ncbi:MAG: MATE family efflux transporter [Bacteriovoracaceae bacterium]|nr:MATE family efflux transporter [Bacteriovoracaceae bacterium]
MSFKKNIYTAKEILIFSLPIIAGQIGQMLFGIGDMLVAARYSSLAVASIGVAAMTFAPFLMVGVGVLLCTGPLASQAKGRGEEDPTLLYNAYYLSFLLSLVLTVILFCAPLYIDFLKLTPEISPHVVDFLQITSFSLFPAFVYQATKDYLQANGYTIAPNVIILFFNIVNVLLNILFMFGYGSFEGYGIKGAAIATLLCRFMMAIVVFLYMKSVMKFEIKRNNQTIKTILRLGSPISFTILCEVLIFTVVTILVGGMSLVAGAAQSLVINITSLTFMVPLALGSAVSVLIGEQFGKKSISGIKRLSTGAMTLTLLLQIFFAIIYLTIPNQVMGLATKDQAVILYGATLLFWVGIFQIPDGLQVVLSGVMRGLNETKIPMLLGLVSYWVIGLPIGVYLAYTDKMEARGLWIGLAIGLTCMCILLIIFYQNRIKKLSHLTHN